MINKIRFFGVTPSFAFNRIGGTDSFFRRIGFELANNGIQIESIHYGYPENRTWSPAKNILIYEFITFDDALKHIAKNKTPLIVNGVLSKDRLKFIHFRWKMRKKVRFYITYSLYAASFKKRFLHFMEAFLYPYNGGALCMSARLTHEVKRWRQKTYLMIPPIPDSLPERPEKDNLIVGFIGRLEDGKGGPEAISILEQACTNKNIQGYISGYSFTEGDGNEQDRNLWTRLQNNSHIDCVWRQHDGWTQNVDDDLKEQLSRIDVLLLPYRSISSSIDTPLLLLEGMAAGCIIITRPLGDIPTILGDSEFLIKDDDFVSSACELIKNITPEIIQQEQGRIARHLKTLNCGTKAVAERLMSILTREIPRAEAQRTQSK